MLHQSRIASAALLALLLVSPAPAEALERPARFGLSDESAVLAVGEGDVRVNIFLDGQPALDAALGGRVAVAGGRSSQRNGGVRWFEHARALALRGLRSSALEAEGRQQPVVSEVEALGGHVIGRDAFRNVVTAVVSRHALARIARLDRVRAITPAPIDHELGLATSSAAIGSPSFWSAGFAGGTGASDRSPIDLAIVADKIEEDHPAFAGVTFQRPSDAPRNTRCGQYVAGCEHGTEVASMAMSGGATGCGSCGAADPGERGVAPQLDTVLDADATGAGVDDALWAIGIGSFGVAAPADPAEVLNVSRGTVATEDDTPFLQGTDQLISTFGTLMARPAGNEGPARTVNEACTAYDTLCMGAFDHHGTVAPTDDSIPAFSSRGPTPGGRKKPDLVAVGVSVFANQHWIRDGNLWEWGEGTSLAAPQGAGAAALLAGSGITSDLAQKAILIDSARQGRAMPGSPMGTQTSWQADWGWGAIDLDAALGERENVQLGEVPGGEVHFYRAAGAAPGDRATLVWHRRAVGCFRPGCSATALTLTNLDLDQLDPTSGAVETRSASSIDNVEQVRSPRSGDVLYKVKASSGVDALPAEPYALAARHPLTRLVTPKPVVATTIGTATARPGEDVRVVAEISNPSADLTAEGASATLELPTGVELAPGSPPTTQSLGTLARAAGAGATRTISWTVRATGDGAYRLRARATAGRYGETFAGEDGVTLTADGTPPAPALATPSGVVADPAIHVSWSATDSGVGVADYDVDVSTDGGPFIAWLAATPATSATYQGSPGHAYRFRVRARDSLRSASPYLTSDAVRVAHPAADPPQLPPPIQLPRVSPELRVTALTRRGAHIRVRGRIADSAAGPITLTGSLSVRGGRLRPRLRVNPSRGRFALSLRAPRRATGKLALRYGGDARLTPQTITVRLRGI